MLAELLKSSSASVNPSATGLLTVIEAGIKLQEERCVYRFAIAKDYSCVIDIACC